MKLVQTAGKWLHDARHWWLAGGLLFVFAITLVCGGLVYAMRAVHATGGSMAIPQLQDDVVYDSLLSQSHLCLHNVTSALPEHTCRMQPLWLIGHGIYRLYGSLPVAMLIMRILIIIGICGWAIVLARRLAERWNLPHERTTAWLLALIVCSPFILVPATVLEYSELSLIGSTIYSVTNGFSWLMYGIVAGGWYAWRDSFRLWPLWGAVAGVWALQHPYFLTFYITLAIAWLALNPHLLRKHLPEAAGALAPAAVVGAYYVWLTLTNPFFQFHLSMNHWPIPVSLGSLIGASLLLSVLALWRWNALTLLDRYLVVWLGVTGAWVMLPTAYQSRQLLLLGWPLAIAATRMIAARPGRALIATGLVGINALLLIIITVMFARAYTLQPASAYAVMPEDKTMADWLREHPGTYLGDEYASERFTWMSQTRIINSHRHESPDYQMWKRLFSVADAVPCAQLSDIIAPTHADIILSRPQSDRVTAAFTACGATSTAVNDHWNVVHWNAHAATTTQP